MQQFKILLLSLNELTPHQLAVIDSWLYRWGAHPILKPQVEISVRNAYFFKDGQVVYDWNRWRERLRFNWYIALGMDTANYLRDISPDGRMVRYGYPLSTLPFPISREAVSAHYDENMTDFVNELIQWSRSS